MTSNFPRPFLAAFVCATAFEYREQVFVVGGERGTLRLPAGYKPGLLVGMDGSRMMAFDGNSARCLSAPEQGASIVLSRRTHAPMSMLG